MTSTPDGWERRDGRLFLQETADVSIIFTENFSGKPFCAYVGAAEGNFEYLADAMNWAEEVNRGRAMVLGLVLPPAQAEFEPPEVPKFLQERGLRG